MSLINTSKYVNIEYNPSIVGQDEMRDLGLGELTSSGMCLIDGTCDVEYEVEMPWWKLDEEVDDLLEEHPSIEIGYTIYIPDLPTWLRFLDGVVGYIAENMEDWIRFMPRWLIS